MFLLQLNILRAAESAANRTASIFWWKWKKLYCLRELFKFFHVEICFARSRKTIRFCPSHQQARTIFVILEAESQVIAHNDQRP